MPDRDVGKVKAIYRKSNRFRNAKAVGFWSPKAWLLSSTTTELSRWATIAFQGLVLPCLLLLDKLDLQGRLNVIVCDRRLNGLDLSIIWSSGVVTIDCHSKSVRLVRPHLSSAARSDDPGGRSSTGSRAPKSGAWCRPRLMAQSMTFSSAFLYLSSGIPNPFEDSEDLVLILMPMDAWNNIVVIRRGSRIYQRLGVVT